MWIIEGWVKGERENEAIKWGIIVDSLIKEGEV
jgi:hypothetical protein